MLLVLNTSVPQTPDFTSITPGQKELPYFEMDGDPLESSKKLIGTMSNTRL
jgi:hypothetical protein